MPIFIAALFYGFSLGAPQWMNGLRKCSIYIHNGVLFSYKEE
jgi:hypothetical protein